MNDDPNQYSERERDELQNMTDNKCRLKFSNNSPSSSRYKHLLAEIGDVAEEIDHRWWCFSGLMVVMSHRA